MPAASLMAQRGHLHSTKSTSGYSSKVVFCVISLYALLLIFILAILISYGTGNKPNVHNVRDRKLHELFEKYRSSRRAVSYDYQISTTLNNNATMGDNGTMGDNDGNELNDYGRKLLTLFTTFKPTKHASVNRNTVRNWAQLHDHVRTILYIDGNPENIAEYAKSYGWEVSPTPKRTDGIPVLRHMFLHARKTSRSSYYGYANGDILFADNLVHTLRGIRRYDLSPILITGVRSNYNMTKYHVQNITTSSDVMSCAKNATLFSSNAQDYFITSSFPWASIPDFLVGKIGYDNWLLVHALRNDIALVDATKTVTALHQTDREGNMAGHSNAKASKQSIYANYKLAGSKFRYDAGFTICSHFYTVKNGGDVGISENDVNIRSRQYSTIKLEKRTKWDGTCMTGLAYYHKYPADFVWRPMKNLTSRRNLPRRIHFSSKNSSDISR